MNRNALILALTLLIALGAAWFLMQGSKSAPKAPDGPVLTLTPSQIRAIAIEPADGPPATALRLSSGRWAYLPTGINELPPLPVSDDYAETLWPIDPSPPQALLRALERIDAAGIAEPGATPSSTGDTPTRFTLLTNTGERTVLTIAAADVAGRTLAQVDDNPAALIDARPIRDALGQGPASWRTTSAMPGLAGSASRILVTPRDQPTIALDRVDGAWALREPVRATADAVFAQALVNALTSIRVLDFPESTAPPTTPQDDAPPLTIDIELDIPRLTPPAPGESPILRVRKRSLVVGRPADAQGRSRHATLNLGNGVTLPLIVDLGAVATNPSILLPRTYIHKRPLTRPGADITGITIVDALTIDAPQRAYTRTLDGWALGDATTTDPSATLIAREILTAIADTDATPVIIEGFEPLTEAGPRARITFMTLGNRTLAELELAELTGERVALINRAQGVAWLYPRQTFPKALLGE